MKNGLKIAFIIPRYDVPQAGGAEVLVKNLAERLSTADFSIDVLTTCAQNHSDWKNVLPVGPQTVNGVCVRRFEVDPRLDPKHFSSLQQRIEQGWPLRTREEESWMAGGFHSQSLYRYLEERQNDWDVLIFAPYLFGMTYRGLQIAPKKSFLIPCLHPEAYASLGIFKKMFQWPRGILFNSQPEKELGIKLFNLSEERCSIVGMGFDERTSVDSAPFLKKNDLKSSSYILYAGRREQGKNVFQLMDYFQTYKKNNPSDMKHILLGSGDIPGRFKSDSDILDIGFVSADEKQAAYQEALLFCQPSVNESFSIVIMESWLASKPVLVNEKCDVTRYRVERSQGGLWYKNYYEFEECVNFFLKNEKMGCRMGESGKRYVLQDFQWKDVLNRLLRAIQEGASQ